MARQMLGLYRPSPGPGNTEQASVNRGLLGATLATYGNYSLTDQQEVNGLFLDAAETVRQKAT
jgi:hypothetical protein